MKRIIVLSITTMLLMLNLCACGAEKGSKIKDYAGYYTATYTTSTGATTYHEAMAIDKDGNVQYGFSTGRSTKTAFVGTIKIENDKGVFYCTDSCGYRADWINDFPLTLTLLNDGNELNAIYTGDKGPRNFTRVSEDELNAYCEEKDIVIDINELKKK